VPRKKNPLETRHLLDDYSVLCEFAIGASHSLDGDSGSYEGHRRQSCDKLDTVAEKKSSMSGGVSTLLMP
jgi:hypothetical protein